MANLAFLLPVASYLIFISGALFAPPNFKWATFLLVWTVGAVGLAWWLQGSAARLLLDRVDRHAGTLAVGLILIASIGLMAVSVWQARHFALSVHAEDTGYYSQVLWNTLHGNFLSGNVQQERLYHPPVSNDLALHVSPALLAVLLPAYAFFPHFLTLLIIRDLALATAAWPLFLLARERMGGTAGVAAVILYLTNPAVLAQGVEAFYLLQLAPLPFFWALRAFVREEPGRFLGWMAVALSMREDVAITMAGFGLWALLRGRRYKWVVLGLGIPLLWWGLSTLVIQPAFGRMGNSSFDLALAGGQKNPAGIYQILLGSPSWLLDGLREGGLRYLYLLLRCVGFLGVMGWEGLVSLPGITANLFLSRVFYSGNDPISRFALLPSCALIGAAVLVVSRIAQRCHRDAEVFAVIALLLLPCVSLLDGVKDAVQERLALYTVRNDASALREATGRIPDGASVAAPNYALPALSKRQKLFYLTYLHMYPQAQPDYILLDRDLDRITRNPQLRERYIALLDRLSRGSDHETIWQLGDYSLLRRMKNSNYSAALAAAEFRPAF